MCRRRPSPWTVVVAIVALTEPSWAAAQQTAEPQQTEEELLARLEALRPQLEEARLAMEAATERARLEEAALDHPPVDTIQVGPVRIVTPPDQVDLAEELFAQVWRDEFSNVTDSPSLTSRYFTFQWRVRPEQIYMTPVEDGGAPVTRVRLFRLGVRTRAQAAARVHSALSETLLSDLPMESPTRRWLTSSPAGALDLSNAFRALSLSATGSAVHSSCLSGDGAACWAAAFLGHLDPELTSLEPWLVPGERLEEARRTLMLANGANSTIRRTLFWHAVRRGGDDAWQHVLAQSEADPAELLTAASGMPPEELGASWRAALEEERPTAHADLSTARWGVLFWVLVFAGFAMRSTRWRWA